MIGAIVTWPRGVACALVMTTSPLVHLSWLQRKFDISRRFCNVVRTRFPAENFLVIGQPSYRPFVAPAWFRRR